MSNLSQKAANSPLIVAEFYGYNPFAIGYEDRKDPPLETRPIDGTSPITLPHRTLMVRFRMSENQVNGDRGVVKKADIENIIYLPFDVWSSGGTCKVITLEYAPTGTKEEKRRIAMKSLRTDGNGKIRERHDVYGITKGRYDGQTVSAAYLQRARTADGSSHQIDVPEIIQRALRKPKLVQLAAA